MAVAFRSAAVSSRSTSGTSMVATLPTGWQPGDLVLLWFVVGDTTTGYSVTPPAGWTQLGSTVTDGTTTGAYALFYRVMQAGDSDPTVSWSASGKPLITAVAYSGVDSTTPIVSSGLALSTANSSTVVGPTVGNTGTGVEWAVAFFGFRTTTSGNKANTYTPPAGLTEQSDANQAANGSAAWVSAEAADSNGAVSSGNHSYTATVVSGGNSTHKGAALVYLNPAAASSLEIDPGKVASAQAVRGADLSPQTATLNAGKVTSSAATRGADLSPQTATLNAGKVTSSEVVHGVDLVAPLLLDVGKVTSSELVHGANLSPQTATLDAGKVATGAFVHGADLAGSGTADLLAGRIRKVANLVRNGGFETDLTDWFVFGTSAHDSTVAKFGSWSMRATKNAAGYQPAAYFSGLPIPDAAAGTAGRVFTLSGWVYVPPGSPQIGVSFGCTIRERGGAQSYDQSTSGFTLVEGWQQVSHTRAIVQNDRVDLELIFDSDSSLWAIGDYFNIDGVQLETGPALGAYVDTNGSERTADVVRGANLAPQTATLTVGKVAGAEVVRGINLQAGAPGALTLSPGKVTSSATTHGANLTPSGAATLNAGKVVGSAALRGVTLAPGTATLPVGRITAGGAVRGITLTPITATLAPAYLAGSTVVYGVALTFGASEVLATLAMSDRPTAALALSEAAGGLTLDDHATAVLALTDTSPGAALLDTATAKVVLSEIPT